MILFLRHSVGRRSHEFGIATLGVRRSVIFISRGLRGPLWCWGIHELAQNDASVCRREASLSCVPTIYVLQARLSYGHEKNMFLMRWIHGSHVSVLYQKVLN